MKEGIGGVFLFNIVIMFILLFTGIMTLTINRSRSYAVKDEIISEIEKAGGINLTTDLPSNIVDVMAQSSYRAEGVCENQDDDIITYDREGNLSGNSLSEKRGSVCISETKVSTSDFAGEGGCYYSVEVFYMMEIPLFEDVFVFSVEGETKILYDICS